MDVYRIGNPGGDGLVYDFGMWSKYSGEYFIFDEKREQLLFINTDKKNGQQRLNSIMISHPGKKNPVKSDFINQQSKKKIILDNYFDWAQQYIKLEQLPERTEVQNEQLCQLEHDILRVLS